MIFTGVIGKTCRPVRPRNRWSQTLRAEGNDTFADLVQRLDVIPGQGIDFTLLGEFLLLALGLYLVSCLFLWLQGYLLNGAATRSCLGGRLRFLQPSL